MNSTNSILDADPRAFAMQVVMLLMLSALLLMHLKLLFKVMPLVWRSMRGADRWLWFVIIALVPILGALLAGKCLEQQECSKRDRDG